MQIPEIAAQYRKNLDTRENNIEKPISDQKNDRTKSAVHLELAMQSLANMNKPRTIKQANIETESSTKPDNSPRYRISKELSEKDIDCLSALGEIHNKALIETGGADSRTKAFSENGEYFPKNRDLNIRESSDDTKPASGLRYGVYDNGNEIIIAVDGLQRGNEKDKKQMFYYMAENTKLPGRKIFATRAESKQLSELENIYKQWAEKAKSEGKSFTLCGYSLGGAMVKSVASANTKDNSTRFVTFNAFATENTEGLASKDLPNVTSFYIEGDKLSNARGFFSGRLFVGPKQGGIPTSIEAKHNLEAFLFCDDATKEYKGILKPGLASC